MVPRSLRRGLLLSLIWAIPGLLAAGQYYALDVYRGVEHGIADGLLSDFVPWQVWALATPFAIAAGRRWPLTRARWWRRLPIHLALNAAIAFTFVWTDVQCGWLAGVEPFDRLGTWDMVPPMLIKSTVLQSLLYWGVIAVDRGLAYQRRYREAALQHAQLEARLVEAQLDALRVQLRPHFLFNTLNAISVLMRKGDGEGAIRMLGGLSELLRRSLTSLRVELAPLRDELDFIAHYIEIELVRFPDRLRVDVDVEPVALDARVPSLLLQPLVENALQHGIAPRARGGKLEITARLITADASGAARLRIEIRDDGVGLRDGHGEGVGISHVRKRLAQLYPGRHRFELAARPGGGTIAALELPLDPAPG